MLLEPRKKPLRQRLSQGRAMTIGVGFMCTDGVSICADRRMSGRDAKYTASKVMSSQQAEGNAFILSYAGTPLVAQGCFRLLKDYLFEEMRKSKKRFPIDKAIDVLPRLLKGRQNKNLELLIGISTEHSDPFLLKTWGADVDDVYSTDFIGFGDSSAVRYLKSFFLPDRLQISINEAEVFGAYFVQVASDFVNYVGGGQDHVCLRKNGIGIGTGDVYPNQRQRFHVCDEKIGQRLRELLVSGGRD